LALDRPAGQKTDWRAILPPALRTAFTKKRKPKLQELATFTQQLANLLSSGMPLTVALNSMTHLETKGIPAEVSKELKQDVMEGRSLSDSMGKQPRIFSDLYINMVRAGESSGALVEVLRRMADHFERFAQVQSKFSSALIYPAFVCIVGFGIMFFFMTYMLPTFLTMFQGLNVELPIMTQMLIGISHIFSGYWWLMLLLVAVCAILFKRFQSSPQGQRKLDEWKLKAPVFGKVVKLNLFGQFARTLSTLLENGVPVLTALKITEQVLPNIVVKEAIAKTREEVTDGKTIAQPLARSKVFPQLMVDLVKIGEDTGNVPGALKNVADTYENELAIQIRVMTNMIEPVMIVVMAAGVAFLLISVLSAMFAITSNIAR
jgi:type II secretory pathway component PulF